MGEQEEGKVDEGVWKREESRGLGGAPRMKEEAPAKTRALEGEASNNHDGLEPANQPSVLSSVFVVSSVFCDMFAMRSSSFVLIYHKKMCRPPAGWQVGVCMRGQLWKLCSVRSGYHTAVFSMVDPLPRRHTWLSAV